MGQDRNSQESRRKRTLASSELRRSGHQRRQWNSVSPVGFDVLGDDGQVRRDSSQRPAEGPESGDIRSRQDAGPEARALSTMSQRRM